jgi:hypothetical protein
MIQERLSGFGLFGRLALVCGLAAALAGCPADDDNVPLDVPRDDATTEGGADADADADAGADADADVGADADADADPDGEDATDVPPVDCSAATDCEECTALSRCGWCPATGSCQEGTTDGPTGGTCEGWRWIGSECAELVDCSTSADCEACSDRAACGWCADSSSCINGTWDGPTSGTCTDWRYGDCTEPDDCTTGTDCATCTEMYDCGWCQETSTCVPGGYDGPTGATCGDWRYGDCDAPPDCTTGTDCASCTAMSICGWCVDTGNCLAGSSTGPTGGACTDWNWYASDCG